MHSDLPSSDDLRMAQRILDIEEARGDKYLGALPIRKRLGIIMMRVKSMHVESLEDAIMKREALEKESASASFDNEYANHIFDDVEIDDEEEIERVELPDEVDDFHDFNDLPVMDLADDFMESEGLADNDELSDLSQLMSHGQQMDEAYGTARVVSDAIDV